MMDSKPLLQDRPPAYSPGAQGSGGGSGYEYGSNTGYGAIPPSQPGFQPPPPYTYPPGPGSELPLATWPPSETEPNPTQLSGASAALSMGHVLHPAVGGGQSRRPPQGYVVPPTAPAHNFPNTTYTIIQQPTTTTSVVVVGGCPACRVGVLEDTFTCLGVLCAIVFFPIGILFCLALRQRRCPNCGATFG